MPRSFNEWDSLTLLELRRYTNFFGNSNIGDITRTSLQCAGMLGPSNEISIVTHWYARISTPASAGSYDGEALQHMISRLAQKAVVVWRLNDRWMWRASLADLFWHRTGLDRAAPRLYWPEVIPTRSFIGAEVIRGSWNEIGLLDLPDAFLAESRVYLHLCGLRLLDSENETDADSIDKVMAALTKVEGERTSVEQRIVDWVMGVAKESDKEGSAQLMAVADAILEGKHR